MILILFTASYPYVAGGEQNFLREELPYLLRAFERVILVPERPESDVEPDLPAIEIEDGYARYLRSHAGASTFVRGLFSRLVREELLSKPWLLLRPAFLKRLLYFAGQAEFTRSWAAAWMRDRGVEATACLFYTYWFYQSALGIGLMKRSAPKLRAVSRAHGYDVYEERQSPPYFPCRAAALKGLDMLFPVSEAGTQYLRSKYPEFASRIESRRLGLKNPNILTAASSDGVFRIVSCSKIVPVKRLPLMMRGIKLAAERRPQQRFEWRHLGNGSLGPELEAELKHLPVNLMVEFLAYTSQAELFEFYRRNCIDVFLNASASEGTPMTLMEAASCGIPVIATAVGGNAEIVSERNGALIAANPTPEQIADALLAYWDEPGQRRTASREVWQSKYDADRNYPEFVRRLVEIRGQA